MSRSLRDDILLCAIAMLVLFVVVLLTDRRAAPQPPLAAHPHEVRP